MPVRREPECLVPLLLRLGLQGGRNRRARLAAAFPQQYPFEYGPVALRAVEEVGLYRKSRGVSLDLVDVGEGPGPLLCGNVEALQPLARHFELAAGAGELLQRLFN
jgi:maltooligosyltrehalose synthase